MIRYVYSRVSTRFRRKTPGDTYGLSTVRWIQAHNDWDVYKSKAEAQMIGFLP